MVGRPAKHEVLGVAMPCSPLRYWGVATGLPRRLCPSDRTASVFYALIWNIDVNFSVS